MEGRRSDELSLGRKLLLAFETKPALDCLLAKNDDGNGVLGIGNDGRFKEARCGEDAGEDVGVGRPYEDVPRSVLVEAEPCLAGLM
jgi:hypothetical protein